jgi:transcriptional regulator with XRE-family HTH domain
LDGKSSVLRKVGFMSKEKLGQFIRDKRTSMKLSRRLFAERLRISEPYLKNVEAGQSRPATEKLFEWAPLLGVDVGTFFELLGEPVPGGKSSPRTIALPFDFSVEAQREVETFAKFLQYREEFEKFLALAGSVPDRNPTVQELDDFAREVQDTFSPGTNEADEDDESEERINKKRGLH